MRIGAATAALAVVAGGTVMTAAPAVADQVWHQSVGRATAESPCPTGSESDRDLGWTEWAASWEEWANDRAGGHVCTRSIVWAKDSPEPTIGCVLGASSPAMLYFSFGSLPVLYSPSTIYSDASCETVYSTDGETVVYAFSLANAEALCYDADPSLTAVDYGTLVWGCRSR